MRSVESHVTMHAIGPLRGVDRARVDPVSVYTGIDVPTISGTRPAHAEPRAAVDKNLDKGGSEAI